jgi:CheY-like chemotaxis protein
MPNGGTLTLATTEVELDRSSFSGEAEVRPGRFVVISVTDDGIGMSREIAERAFEPFFTTKEVGKGSGLGLSMVYGFAKQSNGHVTIYSEVGLGTSIRLYLPIAEKFELAAPRAAETRIAGGDEQILIVEDDTLVRGHAIASLEALGYRIAVASDGLEALAMLRAGARPDLLFTDLVMPGGISGWELAAKARELRPGLKVLFTSGYPLETLIDRSQSDPGARMLAKPYRSVDLARLVREALDE